jgi:hypothetical protein
MKHSAGKGRVQRELLQRFWKNADIQEFEFLTDKKTGKDIIFESRPAAISFFHKIHYSRDDMNYLFWLPLDYDERHYIMTGKPVETDLSTSGEGEQMTCNGFWVCDACGKYYRKTDTITCSNGHELVHENNCSDATVFDLLTFDDFRETDNLLTEKEWNILNELLPDPEKEAEEENDSQMELEEMMEEEAEEEDDDEE